MIKINHHVIDGVDNPVEINAVDEKADGGAHHEYIIRLDGVIEIPDTCIKFQKGPVLEAGLNGVTEVSLLAIVAHRLESFQEGDYPCEENGRALDAIFAALDALQDRTRNRIRRGVEGKSHA
jgi:hypothetical protein